MSSRFAFLFVLLTAAWSVSTAHAQSATVRGLVIDSEDGLALPGATVLLEPVGEGRPYGSATDSDGLYVLAQVPRGRYRLRVSYVGYAPYSDSVDVAAGQVNRFDVTLRPADETLDELVVEGERAPEADYRAGVRSIEPADVERVPVPDVSGDLAAYLTTLPGVVTTGSTGGQLFIRGGEPSQNLVLLDGIPLYQPFHVLGFYSAFPSEIVQEADVYAGGFGARYGGRLSSVIDVASRNGNLRRVEAAASVAPFVSGLRAEFPVVRDRVSVLASGRLSVIDEAGSRLVDESLPYRFGDAFVKLHGRLVENSQLSITGVHTFDEGTLREPTAQQPTPSEVRWRNTGVGARYLFLPGASPFRGEIVVGLTQFDTEIGPPEARFPDREASIEKWTSRMEVTQYGPAYEVRAGMFAGTTQLSSDLEGSRQDGITLTDVGAYLEPEFRLGGDWQVTTGLRLHAFPSLSSTFLEPRLRATWRRGIHQVSVAGGLYHQEIVGVTDRRDAAGVFTVWTPTPVGEVARAVHALVGYRVTPMLGLTLSAEGYAKDLSNLSVGEWTAYPRFTTNLQPADGTAAGLDLRLDVQRGRFNGALSYSLASVRYVAQQAQLPVWYGVEELDYRPTHDRRHQVDALASVTLAGFDLSVRWQFGSGIPYSRALGFDRFLFLDGGVDVFEEPATDRVIYERPFNATLPTYHRLDIAVEREFDLGPAELTVHAGLINAYDRANLFYYDAFTLRRVDQLPLLPSFGLKLAY